MAMNLIFLLSNAFDESSSSSFGGGCAMVETLEKRAPLGCSKAYWLLCSKERNRKEQKGGLYPNLRGKSIHVHDTH